MPLASSALWDRFAASILCLAALLAGDAKKGKKKWHNSLWPLRLSPACFPFLFFPSLLSLFFSFSSPPLFFLLLSLDDAMCKQPHAFCTLHAYFKAMVLFSATMCKLQKKTNSFFRFDGALGDSKHCFVCRCVAVCWVLFFLLERSQQFTAPASGVCVSHPILSSSSFSTTTQEVFFLFSLFCPVFPLVFSPFFFVLCVSFVFLCFFRVRKTRPSSVFWTLPQETKRKKEERRKKKPTRGYERVLVDSLCFLPSPLPLCLPPSLCC